MATEKAKATRGKKLTKGTKLTSIKPLTSSHGVHIKEIQLQLSK